MRRRTPVLGLTALLVPTACGWLQPDGDVQEAFELGP
jgi:hypothetical protein